MTLLLEDTQIIRNPVFTLAKAIYRDHESFLQLLLELCSTETFNRIRNCPTYPVATNTLDLEDRVQLLRDSIALNPYEISNALAFLYESTVDNQIRKNRGQYFTPLPVAKQVISHLALQSGETVLDPGCGTGIFPLSIMRNLIDRSIDSTSITYIGVENDPVLALSAAISLEWIKAPTKWQVHYANFLLLKPGDLPQIDVVIANPPFVRFHRLGDKEKLREGLSRSEKYALSSYSGLHSYFLSHSSQFLKDGRMIFIVPIEMNKTQYGLKLLKQLRQKFTITGKIMYTDKKGPVWHVVDFQELTLKKHIQLSQMWTFMLFSSSTIVEEGRTFSKYSSNGKGDVVHLKSVAEVHRGISTGANDYFVVTKDLVREIGIPQESEYLKKIIPTKIPKADLQDIFTEKDWTILKERGKPCWLLCIPSDIARDELPNELKQYIRKGEREGIHLIPTCRNRRPWYRVRVPENIPDLVFTYISRGYPRFIYNKANIYNLTNLLGIYLRAPNNLSDDRVMDLTRLLNDELQNWIIRESVGRKYVGGLIKFEPGDLKHLPISKSALEKLEISFSSLDLQLEQS